LYCGTNWQIAWENPRLMDSAVFRGENSRTEFLSGQVRLRALRQTLNLGLIAAASWLPGSLWEMP
jgi:hypothetical protein